ncbi:MAG: fibrobacter succinogenes major paralogous domain-containing protein [Bacteroidota bacterium]|nr:fibrobacter succinogenes major paralogous domain-containing protein [Bacteroidota bacterium]
MRNLMIFLLLLISDSLFSQTITDSRDNKEYRTVQIGNQIWMAENLNFATREGSWCYNDDPKNCVIYGRLYDWKTAMDGQQSVNASPSGIKGICPDGWHLPSAEEWNILRDYLGGKEIAGGKMKEKATEHWSPSNVGADNSSGFTALPAGIKDNINNNYSGIGKKAYFWTTTEFNSENAWDRSIYFNKDLRKDFSRKINGLSVRCLKD